MRNRKIGTVEQLELGKAELVDNFIELWVDIESVSDNLRPKIIQAMEEEKMRSVKLMEQLYHREWNETEIRGLSLSIMLQKGKKPETHVVVHFAEKRDSDIIEPDDIALGDGQFAIDLSGYQEELKKIVLEAIVETFFSAA